MQGGFWLQNAWNEASRCWGGYLRRVLRYLPVVSRSPCQPHQQHGWHLPPVRLRLVHGGLPGPLVSSHHRAEQGPQLSLQLPRVVPDWSRRPRKAEMAPRHRGRCRAPITWRKVGMQPSCPGVPIVGATLAVGRLPGLRFPSGRLASGQLWWFCFPACPPRTCSPAAGALSCLCSNCLSLRFGVLRSPEVETALPYHTELWLVVQQLQQEQLICPLQKGRGRGKGQKQLQRLQGEPSPRWMQTWRALLHAQSTLLQIMYKITRKHVLLL